MEPSFLLINIVDSTFHHLRSRWSTLSFKKGASFGDFSFSLLWHSYVLAIQLILYSPNFAARHPPDFVLSWDE